MHANVRVVFAGCRSRQQNERRVPARDIMRVHNEPFANSAPLTRFVDGQVRKVSAVGKVSDGAGDANQSTWTLRVTRCSLTRRHNYVGVS